MFVIELVHHVNQNAYTFIQRTVFLIMENEYSLNVVPKKEVPQQHNGYDCRMYDLMIKELMLNNVVIMEFHVELGIMSMLRNRVTFSIIKGQLDYDSKS